MTSKTRSANSPPTGETDSIPRVSVRDILIALVHFTAGRSSTLENLRLRFCVDREKRGGDSFWSTARDACVELQRLGLLEGGPYPKDGRAYSSMKTNEVRLTDSGERFLSLFKTDRAKAYDDLFVLMYEKHPYLRDFVRVVAERDLVAPVLTSAKDHISPRYATASLLAEDVAAGKVDVESLVGTVGRRLGRPITEPERGEIEAGVLRLSDDSRLSAAIEDSTDFSKKLLLKLNDVVIPAIFREVGLAFDYRTHRLLWSLGEEFKTWASTSSDPHFDAAWVVFRTATVCFRSDESGSAPRVDKIEFDRGVRVIGDGFMEKLWAAYQGLQQLGRGTHVPAWELRAAFCHANRCQLSVFDKLFEEHYNNSGDYELHLEIQRKKPQHETVIRAGQRNVGLIRVVRR